MPKSFRVTLGGPNLPFNRGINTARHRALLMPNEAIEASGVDLAAGTLKGAVALGEAITPTVGTAAKFAAFVGGDHWVDTQYPDWACDDSDLDGAGRTYRTNHATNTTAGNPFYHLGADTYRLGLDYELTAPSATGGSRPGDPQRTYAVTFYSTTTGFESNPTYRTAAVESGASLSSVPRYQDITGGGTVGTIHRRIYATEEGDPDGTLYHYDTITNDTATTYTDAGGAYGSYAIDPQAQDLDWGVGGNVDSETTPFDHSPAPFLTALSEGFMGAQDSESGIPLAAFGSVVCWPHAGKPWAWPVVQQHDVQEYVEATVVWQGQGFAFTASGVWAFTGAADYAITPIKTGAGHGVKAGCGKTVKATPYGILYLTREGLALFDGVTSRIISTPLLDSGFAYSSAYFNAAFFDGFYLLNSWADANPWCFDLRRGLGGMLVTTAAFGYVGDLVVSNRVSIGNDMYGAALYVVDYDTGAISTWKPALSDVGSRTDTWSWISGNVTLDAPGILKRLDRLRITSSLGSGTFRVVVKVGNGLGDVFGAHTKSHTQDVTDGFVDVRLPGEFIGRCFAFSIEPLTGGEDVEVFEMELRGELLDAS